MYLVFRFGSMKTAVLSPLKNNQIDESIEYQPPHHYHKVHKYSTISTILGVRFSIVSSSSQRTKKIDKQKMEKNRLITSRSTSENRRRQAGPIGSGQRRRRRRQTEAGDHRRRDDGPQVEPAEQLTFLHAFPRRRDAGVVVVVVVREDVLVLRRRQFQPACPAAFAGGGHGRWFHTKKTNKNKQKTISFRIEDSLLLLLLLLLHLSMDGGDGAMPASLRRPAPRRPPAAAPLQAGAGVATPAASETHRSVTVVTDADVTVAV